MDNPPLPNNSTFLYLGAITLGLRGGNEILRVLSLTLSRNTSNKNAVSTGPLCASGWNWAVKKGLVSCMMPSLVLSFALVKSVWRGTERKRGGGWWGGEGGGGEKKGGGGEKRASSKDRKRGGKCEERGGRGVRKKGEMGGLEY